MAIGYTPPRFPQENGEALDETELETIIGAEVARSVLHTGSSEADRRAKALRYVQGEMPDLPHKAHRSSYTSRETSDTIGWILPGIMRVFMGGARMPNFKPGGPGDEDMAEQASDYIQHQFIDKNDGYKIVRDASYDALLNSYGVVKQYWQKYPKTETAKLSGITEEQIAILESNGCEILSVSPGEDQAIMDPQGSGQMIPMPVFDVKASYTQTTGHLCYDVIAGEDFFRDSGSTKIEDARFLAQRSEPTRSELVEMGFPMDVVYELPAYSGISNSGDEKLARHREEDSIFGEGRLHASMEKVELYECFIKIDVDGDGIAESVRAYFAGGNGAGKLIYWEEWEDEWPFDVIPCNPMSHRFEGKSVFDDVMDIQQINTTLTRQLFDNLYATNVPMMEAEEGTVLNPEALMSPKFGAVIWRKKGSMGTAPISPVNIPFVGDKIVEAMEFTSNMIEKRTGVSRTTMALDPSAYQDQTATAAQLQTQASYAKLELMARDMAELGWKKVFKKSLKIMVRNQDRKDMIRLRDKWVEMDPSWWNADMDCEVNVGLGTGAAEKDQMALGQIYQTQLQTMGILENAGAMEDALAMIPKIVKTATRMAQSSGIRDASGYYPSLTEADLPKLMEAMQQKSSQPPMEVQIKQMELEAQGQAKQQELQITSQMKLQEMEATNALKAQEAQINASAAANTELAQLQADLETKEKDRIAKAEEDARKYDFEAWKTATVETNKWDIAVLNANASIAAASQDEETEGPDGKIVKRKGKLSVGSDGSISDEAAKRHTETTKRFDDIGSAISNIGKGRKRIKTERGEYVSEVGSDGKRQISTPTGKKYTVEED